MKKWTVKDWVGVIQTILIFGGLVFAGYQLKIQNQTLKDTRKVNSATFLLKISDEINNPKYDKIRLAIENHDSNYQILKTKVHKRFSEDELEDYIGNFETVGDLVNEGLIDEMLVYNEMGWEIEKTWCNKDIQKHIMKTREYDKNTSGKTAFFIEFEKMANTYLRKDHKTYSDMDKE